jgi:uncharacterized lipoprotein YajG
MKHFVILMIVAATALSAGCTKRYSDYGYQPPASAPQQQN